MKKIYMPSMDELYQMQDMGANVYRYLVAKLIESIAMMRTNSGKADVLQEVYKYLREDPNIALSICFMYPDEVQKSEIARYEVDLCRVSLKQEQRQTCNLDKLVGYDKSTQMHFMIVKMVIDMLERELRDNPRYRFEYNSSFLVDKILNREITEEDMRYNEALIPNLLRIEPAYGVVFSDYAFDGIRCDRSDIVRSSVNSYTGRYIITPDTGNQYFGKDILTNPDTDVKRLMRCIKKYNGK